MTDIDSPDYCDHNLGDPRETPEEKEIAQLRKDRAIKSQTIKDLRADLEQTRRDRDNWKASAEVRAHERKIACERLTAAEQRADGAERERESCHQLFDQVIALCGFTKGGGYPGIVGSVEHLAGQRDDAREERDTALRERDGADSLAKLQREAREWADATFPHSDDRARLKHIEKEVQELLQEPADGEEMADILLILSHHAHRHGVDLLSAARAKFEKCKLRKWGKPDEDGVCQHISEGATALAAKTTEGGV